MTAPGAAYVSVDDLAEITPAWRQQLDDNLMPLVAEIYQDSSGETRTQMIDLFGLPPFGNPDSEQYLAQARDRFDAMGQDLWETARSELLDGFQQGESVPELAARVRGAAGISARRAAAIARSEANAAANAGSLATARLADDGDMTKEWLATNDTRTRPSHTAADGQVVPLSERFNVGISTLDYPGDPSGPASETYNCRCTLTYGFADEQQAEEAGPQPVSPSTAERAEQAARSRQQDVDEARKVATAAAEVDELIDAEASQRALKSRINATADRLGLPDDMRTQLLDAAETGDMAALAQAADDIARRAGLTPIGHAGDIARFDRKLHEALAGTRAAADEPIQLARRGYYYQRGDEQILLFKAKVEALGDGLDDLDLRDLRDLAGEFDVPRRLDLGRPELIRALRDRGAVSPDIARALNQLDDDLLAARQRTALAELRAAAIRQYQPNPQGLEDLVARTTDAQLDTATRTQLAGGQVGQIEKIEYPDGYELFGKDSGDWFGRDAKTITDSEQLSSIVARALDAPVPRVLRDGDTHIFTDWAPGKVGNEWFADALHASLDGYPDTDFLRGVVESRPGRRLGLFDLLTGNQDRHTYNWLVTDTGRLTGIDHGNSWWLEDKPDWRAMTDSEFAQLVRGELIGPFVQPWFDQDELEDTGIANPIATEIWSHADVSLTRRRMSKLKPEFERLGHTDWWDYSMRVLDLLEPYATGTGSIYD